MFDWTGSREIRRALVLQITPSKSPTRALGYLAGHLLEGEYLNSSSVDTSGWKGKAAKLLGLEDKPFDIKTFAALVYNIDPRSLSDNFEERMKASMKGPEKIDADKLKKGTKVFVPGHGTGRITGLGLWKAEIRLDTSKEDIVFDIKKLRSPQRSLQPEKQETRLTPRHRPTAGWDFTLSAPKGVSIVWAVGDERIKEAFHSAVDETMEEIEAYAQTRIRLGSGDNQMDEQVDTGNLIWSGFTHATARPVEQANGEVVVDPHLHRHMFVHNVTWDEDEKRFKAMKPRAIYERGAFFQERFEAYLARRVYELGYDIERRGKSWDLAGISPDMTARYSQRTKQVDELAKKLGIKSDKLKGQLGAKSRSSKKLAKDIKIAEHIRSRSSRDFKIATRLSEKAREKQVELNRGPLSAKDRAKMAKEAVDYALDRALERRSTAYKHIVLADAIRYGAAARCLPQDIEKELESRSNIFYGDADKTHRVLLTTDVIVEQERTLIEMVRAGREMRRPLATEYGIKAFIQQEEKTLKAQAAAKEKGQKSRKQALSMEQRAAVIHTLSSNDNVISIRGQAGVGKSFLLGTLVNELNKHRVTPVALAPTAAASRGSLRQSGEENNIKALKEANTLAMFLSDSKTGKELRSKAQGGLIILDEAGLASVPDMLQLMEQAQKLGSRVLLMGDTRQLSSVQRGDALRLLEDDGLIPAELKEIHRQKKNPVYKAIVEKLAQGKAAEGLESARKAKCVVEVKSQFKEDEDNIEYMARMERLAAKAAAVHVADSYKKNRSNIVVAPTHDLGRTVTTAIRRELQAIGVVGKDTASVSSFRQVNRTQADLRDAAHTLEAGDIAVLRREDKASGLSKDDVLEAREDDKGKVYLHRQNAIHSRITRLDPRSYTVYRREEIPIAVGDKIRAFEPIEGMTRGEIGTIKSINCRNRTITLTDERKLSMDSKHIGYGYVVTAQASQGLSVDDAIFVATTASFPAVFKQGLYVGASRGGERLVIITDDFEALKEAAERSAERAHGVTIAKESHIREMQEKGITIDMSKLEQDILNVPAITPSKTTKDLPPKLTSAKAFDTTSKFYSFLTKNLGRVARDKAPKAEKPHDTTKHEAPVTRDIDKKARDEVSIHAETDDNKMRSARETPNTAVEQSHMNAPEDTFSHFRANKERTHELDGPSIGD